MLTLAFHQKKLVMNATTTKQYNTVLSQGHDAKVEFVKDSSGKVIEQIIHRPNLELHYKKVE